jgi:hypothetical protein
MNSDLKNILARIFCAASVIYITGWITYILVTAVTWYNVIAFYCWLLVLVPFLRSRILRASPKDADGDHRKAAR